MKAALLSPNLMVPLVSHDFKQSYQQSLQDPQGVAQARLPSWERVNQRLKLEKDIAKTIFPEHNWVAPGPERLQWALDDTQKFLENPDARFLQNGSFFVALNPKDNHHTYGLYSRPFMLERADAAASRYNLYEVLLGDGPSEMELLQLSIQYYVLTQAGVALDHVYYIVRSGEILAGGEGANKYEMRDYTDRVLEKLPTVTRHMEEIAALVRENPPPDTGGHLLEGLDYPVSALMPSKFKYWIVDRLVALGIIDMRHVPLNFRGLEEIHREQIKVHRDGRPFFNLQGLREVFKQRQYPVHYLDFETRVYNAGQPDELQIPHQFSNHILDKEGRLLSHDFFLPEKSGDPRLDFARALVASVNKFGGEGTIVVYYEKFEKARIAEVADYVRGLGHTELADDLLKILTRIDDQREYLKENVYHPGFKGSYSLKTTHPVLIENPRYDYHTLDVQDGMQAAHALAELMGLLEYVKEGNAGRRIQEISTHLQTYCGADTWNNVEIDCLLMQMLQDAGMV